MARRGCYNFELGVGEPAEADGDGEPLSPGDGDADDGLGDADDGDGDPEEGDGDPDDGDGDPDDGEGDALCGDGEADCGDGEADWGDGLPDCGGGLPDWGGGDPVGGSGGGGVDELDWLNSRIARSTATIAISSMSSQETTIDSRPARSYRPGHGNGHRRDMPGSVRSIQCRR